MADPVKAAGGAISGTVNLAKQFAGPVAIGAVALTVVGGGAPALLAGAGEGTQMIVDGVSNALA